MAVPVRSWAGGALGRGGATFEAPGSGIAAELERQVIEGIVAREVGLARALQCSAVGVSLPRVCARICVRSSASLCSCGS